MVLTQPFNSLDYSYRLEQDSRWPKNAFCQNSKKRWKGGGGIETKHTVTHFATCEPIIAIPSGILAENGLQVVGENVRINKIMRVSINLVAKLKMCLPHVRINREPLSLE